MFDYKDKVVVEITSREGLRLEGRIVKVLDRKLKQLVGKVYFKNNKCALFIDMHHIISDGKSLNIFIDELCKLYNGYPLTKLDITYKDFSFFENLPITFRYEKDGYPAITCCHGSPSSTRELLLVEQDNTKTWLDSVDTDYLLCAHTHFPGELEYKGKHYYNSGCVGIAINDCGFAQCMILEDVTENGKLEWKPTFLKIPYDNKKVVEDIRKSGLLDKAPWFINSNIQILLAGIDHSAEMVVAASNKALEADKEAVWPRIGEKYFKEAAGEVGVPEYRGVM